MSCPSQETASERNAQAAQGPPPPSHGNLTEDRPMTWQQSLELAELEADIAEEAYLAAFEAEEHPEILEQLRTEATITRHRYYEAYNSDLAH